MAVSPEYKAFIEELIEPLGPVSIRGMFGGAGLFYEGVMFALIVGETLYLKVDERNQPDFEAEGQAPFGYETDAGRRSLKSYYEIPERLLDEPDELVDWCRRAIDAALKANAKKPGKKNKSGKKERGTQ